MLKNLLVVVVGVVIIFISLYLVIPEPYKLVASIIVSLSGIIIGFAINFYENLKYIKNYFGGPDIEKMKAKNQIDKLRIIVSENKDVEQRIKAAKALGELKSNESIETLMVNYQNCEYPALRNAIGEAVLQIGNITAIKMFVYFSIDPKYDWGGLREHAKKMIQDPRAKPGILEIVKNPGNIKSQMVVAAAETLGKYHGDSDVIRGLRNLLKQSQNVDIILGVASSLTNFKDPVVLLDLINKKVGYFNKKIELKKQEKANAHFLENHTIEDDIKKMQLNLKYFLESVDTVCDNLADHDILPLIEALKNTSHDENKGEIVRCLNKITKQNLGFDTSEWDKYYHGLKS